MTMMAEAKSTLKRPRLPPAPLRKRTLRIVDSVDDAAIGRALALDGSTYTLGRSIKGPGLIDDPHVSREHARVRPAPAGLMYLIEDCNTANGTYLNGARVSGAQSLNVRDVLAIGETLLVVDQEPDPDELPIATELDLRDDEVEELVGMSHAAERMRGAIASVARAAGPVFLLGPTGAGKEVAARAIHRLSARPGPFIAVNCAAISADIADAELFGHRRGAFTGAVADKAGFFAQADRGTLFLDEIGELALPLQAKLLRVLEDGVFQAVGAEHAEHIDVRVIAATNAAIDEARFRPDLYARISEYVLRLPPLYDRRADVLLLWEHFQRELSPAPRQRTAAFSEALLLHPWAMNVRELSKLARRLNTYVGRDEAFDVHHLPREMVQRLRERDGAHALQTDDVDKRENVGPGRTAIEAALKEAHGNIAQVATHFEVHRQQVYRWIRRLGLDLRQYR